MSKENTESVSSLVVMLPAAEDTMQHKEVTLESLTRSYREGLLLDGPSEDEEDGANENDAEVGGKASQRGVNQRRPQRPSATMPQTAAPSSTASIASASWRQPQGVPLTATLFNPALTLSNQLCKPPGYFLVTPRLGERANLERRRWALRKTRRGQLLQVLGEPYWPAHSVPSRPATARPAVSSKSFARNKEQQRQQQQQQQQQQWQQQQQQQQQQRQQQQQSFVSLASLIKRFPEDFVRLPTPDFHNSGLTGSRVGISCRPPSATASTVMSRMPTSPVNCGVGDSEQRYYEYQHQDRRQRLRPSTGRLPSSYNHGDWFRTAGGEFFAQGEWASEAADQLRVDGSPLLAQQPQQHPKRCRSAPPKRDVM